MSEAPSIDRPGVPVAAVAAACRGEMRGEARVEVTDVTHDSRDTGPGVLYACRPGRSADGHDFAPEAATRGAAALLVERWLDVDLPQVRVPSVADAMGPLASRVHGDPSERLDVFGITGTNGKTTTAYLLEAVLAAAGRVTGLIGTVETRIAGDAVPGVRTTPEATDLQRLLRRMVDAGVDAASMEVSSHGLSLGRVRGTRFSAVGFTNLSQDHLDFHRDMEEYFAAKRALFDGSYADVGVVSVDDRWGQRLATAAGTSRVITLSMSDPSADVHASDVRQTPSGSVMTAHLAGQTVRVATPLIGPFNVANALLALALAEAGGVDVAAGARGLEALPGVPGRMEVVDEGQPFAVLVDYAHTPDAVERVLAAARAAAGGQGRVLVVLGCGGDRDREKRPQMGRAATAGSDLAVLTSDNPRSEDPMAILDEVASGAATGGGDWEVEPDRRAAIARALGAAGAGDVVVIAGKGHEATQEVAGVHHPFDDRLVAAEVLRGGKA